MAGFWHRYAVGATAGGPRPGGRQGARYRVFMAAISATTLENGLPLYRIPVVGTRSVTIMVAFDAGARSERAEENGMAHFLEHLVFKGGEKYPTYRDVNQAAEGIGAVINAYTSHDLVAFHITARAERALEAADLLTDFVGRPLIDQAAFGDHPLGRPVLGSVEHIRDRFTREGIVAFRSRRWSPSRGGAFLVGNLEHLEAGPVDELFARFPSHPEPDAYEPAPQFQARVLVRERDSNQSHLRMAYRPEVDSSDSARRAALQIYSTLLGGSMASRLFDEIREQRGLAYSVGSFAHAYSDVPVLEMSAGLQSDKAVEAYTRMREIVSELRDGGPTRDEVERARAYAAGARAIAFENSRAVASHAAQQRVVYDEDVDPDLAIRLLDEVSFEQVVETASRVADELAVAVVGPHTTEDFPAA